MSQTLVFGGCRLDLGNESLWRDDERIPLRPKTFAVLRYLVTNSRRLVTKEELLDSVWPQCRRGRGATEGLRA
jgi:DNA-binding winged helix-turn-helix (wHTH) protein